MGKDLALLALGKYGTEIASYKAVEYSGACVSTLTLSDKMALANMAVEMAAKTSFIEPTSDVIKYVRERTSLDLEPVYTDPSFRYEQVLDLSVDALEPLVACPSRVDNVHPVSEVEGEPVQQALIGTCTGGRVEDIEMAVQILRGRKVHKECRLLVAPASSEVLSQAISRGLISALLDAGATLVTPGCGPCLGAHDGVLAPGESCISASSRNFPGRMGSSESKVFVASPATVAASAINARIADPRRYLLGE